MRTKILAITFFSLILIGSVLYYIRNRQSSPPPYTPLTTENNSAVQNSESLSKNLSLRGTTTDNTNRPIAVVIENHPDSRPQSGLIDADIVYETLAEGGITRFLAVFQTESAKNIGPIRSARPYFAEIANEWGAIFAHVGGSDEALDKIKDGSWNKLDDADEYSNGNYFKRVTTRTAPHNVYTSIEKLRQLETEKKWQNEVGVLPWEYNSTPPESAEKTQGKICLDFSILTYRACYFYNATTNTYKRELAGKFAVDAEKKTTIAPSNILVQYVAVTPVPGDAKLRVNITTTGNGKAVLFRDGKVIKAKWSKQGTEQTKFYTEDGKPLTLTPGQTWVELIPSGKATWETITNTQNN